MVPLYLWKNREEEEEKIKVKFIMNTFNFELLCKLLRYVL